MSLFVLCFVFHLFVLQSYVGETQVLAVMYDIIAKIIFFIFTLRDWIGFVLFNDTWSQ